MPIFWPWPGETPLGSAQEQVKKSHGCLQPSKGNSSRRLIKTGQIPMDVAEQIYPWGSSLWWEVLMEWEERKDGQDTAPGWRLPLLSLTKYWLEKNRWARCEKQEADKQKIEELRLCGGFSTQKPKISKNRAGERIENADSSQAMLAGAAATAPSAEGTGRARVVLPEPQPGFKWKPKQQHPKQPNKYLPQTGRCNEASFVTHTQSPAGTCVYGLLWECCDLNFIHYLGGFFLHLSRNANSGALDFVPVFIQNARWISASNELF